MKNKITRYDVLKSACKAIVIEDLAKPIVSTISAFVLPGDLQKTVSKKLKLYDDKGEERLRDRVLGYINTHDRPCDAAGLMESLTAGNMQVKERMHDVAALEFVLGLAGLLTGGAAYAGMAVAGTAGGLYGLASAGYAIADGYIRKRTVSSSSLCGQRYCGCDFTGGPRLDGEPCGTLAVEVPYQIGMAAYTHLKSTYENAERELMKPVR